MLKYLASLALAGLAVPAAAQPQMRTLSVAADAPWRHERTGVTLPPQLADLRRVSVHDATRSELDVNLGYRGSDGTVATLYLFRTSLPELSIWFDRAVTTMMYSPRTGLSGAQPPQAVAIMPSGSARAGLMATSDMSARGFRSTGLALLPLADNFFLKIRLTSPTEDSAQLRERLQRLVEEIGWPAGDAQGAASTAAAIRPCPQPLRLRRARVVEADFAESLLAGLIGSPAAIGRQENGTFCREPMLRGVYRLNAATDSYVVAIGDSGLAIRLAPATGVDDRRSGRYAMTWIDRTGIGVLPSFDRLPPPDQALETAASNRNRQTIRVEPGRR